MSTVSAKDLKTAHLAPQDIYKFEVDAIDKREGTSKEGETYEFLLARCSLTEAMGALKPENAGQLARPITVFQRFYLRGKALAQFTAFFKAITGYIPAGEVNPDSGEHEVNVEDMIDEVRGGTAWGVYRHSGEAADGSAYGGFTYQFSDDPSKLRAPRA